MIFSAPQGDPVAEPLYITFLTPKKAFAFISVTLSGTFKVISPVQPLKASEPIFLIEFGMLKDLKFVQPLNARSQIFVIKNFFPLNLRLFDI